MRISDKIKVAKRAVESVSQHEDEDSVVRVTALQAIEKFVQGEIVKILADTAEAAQRALTE